jgi:O-methyltransferase involved in polyketide biosynthesis
MISGACSRIAFSYISSNKEGFLDVGRWTGLMLCLQKFAGEPWLWCIRPEELGQFMEELGWTATSSQGDLKYKYGVEYFAVAKK